MNEAKAGSVWHGCYRCGKEEQEGQPFRLLPGSTHITLCPDCYEVIWGWHEHPPQPPADERQGKRQAGRRKPG